MSIELKIKAKHLALEPAIIRHEEEKLKKQIKYLIAKKEDSSKVYYQLIHLSSHRKWNVCNEARATNLTRTFLAGKPYTFTEKKRRQDRESTFQVYIIPRIAAMTKKYGNYEQRSLDDKVMLDKIRQWSTLS